MILRRLSAFAFILLCWAPAWSLDGIEVNNGEKPKKKHSLKLVEDLRVGNDGEDDNFIWGGENVGIQVNNEGHIFVVVPVEHHIIELDKQGKFVRKIGGKGTGPGEFQNLMSFQILADGSARALEYAGATWRISYFDKDMKFKDRLTRTSLDMVVERTIFSPDGNLCLANVVHVNQQEKQYYNRFVVLDEKMELKKQLMEADPTIGFDGQRATDRSFWIEFLGARLAPSAKGQVGWGNFDKEGNLYTTITNSYTITKWDKNLNKLMTIKRQAKPKLVTPEEAEIMAASMAAESRSQLPQHMAEIISDAVMSEALKVAGVGENALFAEELKITDDGHIIAVTQGSFVDNSAVLDLFSAEGVFLGSTQTNRFIANSLTFRNGFAYALDRDANDESQAVRFKYKIVAD